MSEHEESRRVVRSALRLSRQTGDLYAQGNSLNILSFTETDLAEKLRLLNQANDAFLAAGYKERQLACLNNLADAYAALGLERRMHRLRLEQEKFARQAGLQMTLAFALIGLVLGEIRLGHAANARRHTDELLAMLPSLGQSAVAAYIPSLPGQLALLENRFAAAISELSSALAIAHEAGDLSTEIASLIYLGQAYLGAGELAAALQSTMKAADLHRAHKFGTLDDFSAQEVWWRHSQVLAANQQPDEAEKALDRAYQLLLAGIAGMSDEGLRRNYLNKVQVNREIIAARVAWDAKRALPHGERYAHLAGEADLREPFQRLVDTGLRLNELRDAANLQSFLIDEVTELSGAERVLLILDGPEGMGVVESLLPEVYEAAGLLAASADLLEQVRRSRALQMEPALSPESPTPSRIVAPLIAQNKLLGYLYLEMDAIYGSFNEADRDMMGMLANQAAAALENAEWVAGMEKQVAERTADLNQRVDELQIINDIQQALAEELDFQAIIDLVGDKLRDVFNADGLDINWYDEKNNLIHYLYSCEQGQRYPLTIEPPLRGGILETLIKTRQPIVLNNQADRAKINIEHAPGTLPSRSLITVPIIGSDRVLGNIMVYDYAREDAYGEADIRLLTTVTASLGTALENARLFDETQRLLQETEQRNAELAIINSVQAALAAELDIQGIYEAVGDKIREIFRNRIWAFVF